MTCTSLDCNQVYLCTDVPVRVGAGGEVNVPRWSCFAQVHFGYVSAAPGPGASPAVGAGSPPAAEAGANPQPQALNFE
jgi:hypothetical protein